MLLTEYEIRYNDILNVEIEQDKKDKLLSGLMTDMERNFQIPIIKNANWEDQNPEVFVLYRKVANSRSL